MKILLATDGSEYSARAAKFLTYLNLSSDDEITVFHAVYWIPFLYDKEFYYETLKEIKKDVAPKIVDFTLDILKPVKARLSTAIVEGPPEICIVDAAGRSDMDMIVMGARGIRGVKSFFIGSVTREVSVRSSKPVLVVKMPPPEKPGRLKVLFAADGSDSSLGTGELLSKMPFQDDTDISILNVMPSGFLDIPETFAPDIIEGMIEVEEKIRQRRLAESHRVLEDARGQLRRFGNVKVLSEVGDSSTEILRAAERLKTDVIAMGCRGLRGIKGMMGSVSRNILTHSECSVLIGKTCY